MKAPKVLIGMLVVLIAITALTFATLQYLEINADHYVEIDVIKVGDNGFIFLSNDSCVGIVARASEERAESIRMGVDKEIGTRPNTHDTFAETLKHFDITLDKVIVKKIVDNTFHAEMYLQQGDRVLILDSKPSDAIATALRTNSSIYFNKTLFEIRKEKIC